MTTLTQSELATKLNRSARTIARAVDDLEKRYGVTLGTKQGTSKLYDKQTCDLIEKKVMGYALPKELSLMTPTEVMDAESEVYEVEVVEPELHCHKLALRPDTELQPFSLGIQGVDTRALDAQTTQYVQDANNTLTVLGSLIRGVVNREVDTAIAMAKNDIGHQFSQGMRDIAVELATQLQPK
jgi:hypothetical protein